MKHLARYGQWLHESSESKDSTQQRLEDIEQLYALGMIDPQELLGERIRLRGKLGQLSALTLSEIELVAPESAEILNDLVNENTLDVNYGYAFTNDEESSAAMEFVERDQHVEIDWQAYPDGTLDVSMYFPELGPDQLIYWTDPDGTPQSRWVLEYYDSPLVSRLDPEGISGSIEPWNSYQDLIQELFVELLEGEDTGDE
ncbi:hypothetical protein UFOVP972_79 [uncultured Caudovirales phage]|uniref:Uncharacterized protein n=1 Tax=uncultured Caudovirales phage TaxID=2100421 RepID=A0A6J5PVB1_9CAUD|nr:hypothetical protein UFOVP972_79 [uncultured Caudovirales phage]